MWVAVVPCCLSILIPVNNACLGLFSLWVLVIPVFLADWWCLSLALQYVSGNGTLLSFYPDPCWQYLFLAFQSVSGCCALLCFQPVNNACLWFFREWVTVVSFCVINLLILVFDSLVCEWLWCLSYFCSLLTMPVLDFLVCEWLWWLSLFLAYWQCLSLALQPVSGCSALLYLWCANNACP